MKSMSALLKKKLPYILGRNYLVMGSLYRHYEQ
jgi:hypothetical protein